MEYSDILIFKKNYFFYRFLLYNNDIKLNYEDNIKMETEKIKLDFDDMIFLEHQMNDLLKRLLKEQKEEIALRGYPNKWIEYDIKSCTKILEKLG